MGSEAIMRRFEDRVALVTGAANGMGLACAERLAAEGASVVLADVIADAGRAAAERIVLVARAHCPGVWRSRRGARLDPKRAARAIA